MFVKDQKPGRQSNWKLNLCLVTSMTSWFGSSMFWIAFINCNHKPTWEPSITQYEWCDMLPEYLLLRLILVDWTPNLRSDKLPLNHISPGKTFYCFRGCEYCVVNNTEFEVTFEVDDYATLNERPCFNNLSYWQHFGSFKVNCISISKKFKASDELDPRTAFLFLSGISEIFSERISQYC